MANIPLTERLLADAGGWQVLKHARALWETGRVSGPVYKPPLLLGLVREGDRDYRAGLRIDSPTRVENLCGCRISRESGTICAHSVAVGLALIRPPKETVPTVTRPAGPPAADLGLVVDENAPQRLHVVLPPNFIDGWKRGSLTVGFEIEQNGTKKLLQETVVSTIRNWLSADKVVIQYLSTIDSLAGVVTLGEADSAKLFTALVGHPRVSLGRKEALRVRSPERLLKLKVQSGADGTGLSLTLVPPTDGETMFMTDSAWNWCKKTLSLTLLAPGLPKQYSGLFSGEPVVISGDGASAFLVEEVPILRRWFSIDAEAADSAAVPLNVVPATPRLVLKFEGSLNHLQATLQAIYGNGRMVTIGVTSPREQFTFPRGEAPGQFSCRNVEMEESALARLRQLGFRGPDTRGAYALDGQDAILRFFATGLPVLQMEWEVRTGARFQRITDQQLEIVRPEFEIRGSGENWLDLGVSLVAARSGQRFSPAEMARLLEMGRDHQRLPNGRIAVFPAQSVDDLQQVLLDCDSSQLQAGVYRVARRHTAYLDATLRELGIPSASWEELRRGERRLAPPEPVDLPVSISGLLRPYQRDGVAWLDFLSRNGLGGVLADEMGLGKTLQALAFLVALRRRSPANAPPVLVICPTSLIENWRREAANFTPELRVATLSGPDRFARWNGPDEIDLLLTSYALLRRDADFHRTQQYAAAILDEAHFIKNPDSQTARAAFAIQAPHRFVLTGTPMENSVRDVWSVMQFAMPGYLGKRDDFRERYELPIARDADPDAQARLARRLRPVLLRRRKDEVARDLPEKLEQVAYCELTDAQAAAYREILEQGRRTIEETGDERAGRMLILSTLLRLRQACCDLRLLGVDVAEAGATESDEEETQLAAPMLGSAKLALLAELLEQAREGGHRVLIFSQFVSMLKLIAAQLDGVGQAYAYLDGSTKDRQAEVDRFQRDDNLLAFLISLKAGGTGLNLTAADTVIHFDPWWNPAVQAQATDRAHRIGQERVVTSYQLITRDTVEEKILNLQRRKRDATEAVIERERLRGGPGRIEHGGDDGTLELIAGI